MSHASPPRDDRDAEYYEDLLAAAAFGTLDSDEAAELRAYLESNPDARDALADLRELASMLSLVAGEADPSPALRDRIEGTIASGEAREMGMPNGIQPLPVSPEPEPTRLHAPRVAWNASLWAAAAALVIALAAGLVLGRYFFADTENEPAPEVIAFEMATPIPDLTAELTYDPDRELFMLDTENMPHAPAGQVYQVWLIDKANVPQPMGVMERESFAVTADRDDYTAFAITVEPGPLGSEAPTSQPFFVAPLTPDAGG